MNTAQTIREAVAQVEAMRHETHAVPWMRDAVVKVKRLQARRFAGTYADLLASPRYAAAARFFLEELYGDRDYADRDTQFARIASAVERFFPRDVADTAAALARLHALTETLDHEMARARRSAGDDAGSYVLAWRAVGRRADRERQLEDLLALGSEMSRLTRLGGLRTMLRMMRAPALAAGLGSLQRFLEAGFDTFAGVAKTPGGAERFLATIREREEALMLLLFDADPALATEELRAALARGAAP